VLHDGCIEPLNPHCAAGAPQHERLAGVAAVLLAIRVVGTDPGWCWY
jgi:hypothetical protein